MEKLDPKLLSWASMLEDNTRDQALQTAHVPWVNPYVALMPDAHLGRGSTVGSVVCTDDVVMPACVGVDIGCVDGATEYLSPVGWRRIDSYEGGPVMQYDPNTGIGRWVTPEAYIVKRCPEFLRLHTKYGVDQMLSPDHRVLLWRIVGRDRRREMTVMTAKELETRHNELTQGIKAEFETTFTPDIESRIELTDDQIRVQVMVYADGHIDDSKMVLRLTKERKIRRARDLLIAASIGWTEHVGADGVTVLRFAPAACAAARLAKSYTARWWLASSDQLKVIADEVLHWDGNLDDRVYFTRDRMSADFIHYVFTATGSRSVLREDLGANGVMDYRVFRHDNTRVGIAGAPKTPITRESSIDGNAYCFTVPSGFWVMRRGGNIAMTGNCGMAAVRTSLTVADMDDIGDLTGLRRRIEAAVPVAMGGYTTELSTTGHARITGLEDEAEQHGVDPDRFAANWRMHLGTLGSGNHFIEISYDEEDRVWVFLHSGSRGVGNKIAREFTTTAQKLCERWHVDLPHPDLAFLPVGEAAFTEYLAHLKWAQNFAEHNRAEMVDQVFGCVTDWADRPVSREETIQCHHNYTARETHHNRPRWITRKGAINAEAGRRGLIPGSMGAASYVVTGKGDVASYHSAPHGAGRNFSRTEARKRFSVDQLTDAMKGIEWSQERAGSFLDEAPGAYKDIDRVMADAADLVTVDHTLRQIVNVKGSTEEKGRWRASRHH